MIRHTDEWIAHHSHPSPFRLAADGEATLKVPEVYAENLMLGYSVFARRKRSKRSKDWGRWRSLCLRQVQILSQNLAWLDKPIYEEGFVGLSVMSAPRPYVGLITARPETYKAFSLNVINARNEVEFACMCEPLLNSKSDSPNSELLTRFGGIFRPYLNWQ